MKDNSFSAHERIRLQADFDRIKNKGTRVFAEPFIFIGRLREEGEAATKTRIGVIASKRSISKAAVRRNRAKRLTRELFRQNKDLLPEGLDLLIITRRAILELPFGELEVLYKATCEKLCKKLES